MRPAITWESRIATVAGPKAGKIEQAFGYHTVGELLRHYPRRYVDKGSVSALDSLVVGDHVTVIATVVSAEQKTYEDKRTHRPAYRLEVVLATEHHRLPITFFDKRKQTADWRARAIRPGVSGWFSGKVTQFHGAWQLTNPKFKVFTDGDGDGEVDDSSAADQAAASFADLPNLLTIYPATAAVESWQIAAAIGLALDLLEEVPEVLPPAVRLGQGLVGARQALEWIHRPDSWSEKAAAEERLRFEEAFVLQTALAQRRAAVRAKDAQPRTGTPGGLLDRFDAGLPFSLTTGQREVGEEILHDLAAGHPMHRLLQGEVASGKTVVALRAMLRVVDSGGQAALLAPTEVLAQQHHRSITAMLGELATGGMLGGEGDGTRVALLTGSLGARARRAALADAESGAAGIVIGTHALLEESVRFHDLGLVVVDEQHRFGVEQRAALSGRSDGSLPPHVLVMTATPIPRTVAMTLFGDLESSTLTELPTGRADIDTVVVPLAEQPRWQLRIWERVREEVQRGHQVYVVCPRIGPGAAGRLEEEADELDKDDEAQPAAVELVAPALAAGPLDGLRVESLHGRLPPDRKEAVMRAFAAGEIHVLVATTVVEVGLDVGNATAMVVLDADRFGVSQLHQMRGRIGRAGLPGLCLLVTQVATGTPARERLDAVAATADGFELARLDLEQRREGDVLGSAQAGRRSSLLLLSVLRDAEVIAAAREAAAKVVDADGSLSRHPALAQAVRALDEREQGDYLEKG